KDRATRTASGLDRQLALNTQREAPMIDLKTSRRKLLQMALATGGAMTLPIAGRRALAQTPVRGGVLQAAISETIDTLDAYSTSATLVRIMIHHTAGSLYTYSANYGVIPELAEGHEVSADGRVWT